MKEESEKAGLKLSIQKMKIMASCSIPAQQADAEKMVTAATKFKKCLFLGRKAMTNLDSILKSRDITLPTKVSSQSYGFSSSHVWMCELDYEES